MQFVTKIRKKLKSGSWYPFYNSFCERVPLNKKMILLESRSGSALESNIFAILKELQKDVYRSFCLVLSVRRDSENTIKNKIIQHELRVKTVTTGSVAYYYYLSRAGYLVSDTSFPGRFIKKKGQIYLNTWHGTPLKKMGRDNQAETVLMGNVMRNLLCADFLVFPNEYMEEKMSGAYMLKELYKGTVLHEGYPRNDVFCAGESGISPEVPRGFSGKHLFAYFPTYRGIFDSIEEKSYLRTLNGFLKIWDSGLHEDELLLVKLHPFIHAGIDFGKYRHIRPFPGVWDTNEGLSRCEALITDYSSVMYDYAISRNKIILFAYDRGEYENTRGMYDDIRQYPFQYTEKAEEVLSLLHQSGGGAGDEFLKKYATYEDGSGASRICRHVFLKENCCRLKHYTGDGKGNILIYGGDLGQNGITTALICMLREIDLEKYHYFISFRRSCVEDHPEKIALLPEEIGLYPLASEMNMDLLTAVALVCRMKLGLNAGWIKKRLEKAYRREWRKHFGDSDFHHVVHYNGYEAYIISLLEEAPCRRTIWVHNDMEKEIRTKKNQNRYLLHQAYRSYDHVIAVSDDILNSIYSISGKKDNVQVIFNCHDYQAVLKRSEEKICFYKETSANVSADRLKTVLDSQDPKFISIGRFSPEKGHARLIEAFTKYWKSHRNTWLLIIGGAGPLYAYTKTLAEKAASSSHIILVQSLRNPMPVLKRCDLFLLSSYYEGRPVVLLEAATLGLPVMACDVNGTRGLMKKYGGTLVEDSVDGLVHGMELFADRKVNTLQIDFEELNRDSAAKIERLFDEDRKTVILNR